MNLDDNKGFNLSLLCFLPFLGSTDNNVHFFISCL